MKKVCYMKKEEIIKSEAQEFYEFGDWKQKHIFPTAQDLIDDLKLELRNHQVEGQIIYLKQVIRLIDNDAQKHVETCKKQENPNECPDYQFYAKSRYYAEQILDSIDDENDFVETKFEFKKNLSKETLSVLEDLLNGEKFPLTKDNPNEIHVIIDSLNSMGFLNKVNGNHYAMNHGNRKYLAKLLELKSWNKFKEWLNKEENSREASVTNIFNESSVGQLNQAIGGGTINNSESKTHATSKNSLLNKMYWVIGIVVSLIVVYEFVIKQFVK